MTAGTPDRYAALNAEIDRLRGDPDFEREVADSAAVGVPVARPWLIVRERGDGAREQAWSAVVDEAGHADRGGHLVTQQGSEWQEVES